MNTEEKSKAYDEAIEKSKEFYTQCKQCGAKDTAEFLESIFPELKESEDERIKKEIIQFLQLPHPQFVGKRNHEEWIAWLEKQGKEKHTCRNCQTFQDMHQNCPHSPIHQYTDLKEAHKHLDDETSCEFWVEKQGEQKLFNDDKYQTVPVKILDRLYESEKELERLKQYEQNPTDKVEPNFNFKVGQWIVAAGKCVYLITKIDGFNVTLVDTYGDECVFDAGSLDEAHLWTIQDANDGDVLAFNDDTIVIFKDFTSFHSYCHIEDGIFDINDEDLPDWWESEGFQPATKKQHDIFFQKMKDAGYKWDSEKRELRKI